MNNLKISRRGKPVIWEIKEEDYIKDNVSKLSTKDIANNLNRASNQVAWYIRKNKLFKDMSQIIKNQYANGRIHQKLGKKMSITSINKRNETIRTRYGKLIAWNKGLNKDSDERVKNYGLNVSKSKKGIKNPLTSKFFRESYANGTMISPMLGKNKHNSDWGRMISERMKKNNPMKRPEIVAKANSPENMKKRFRKMLATPTLPERILTKLIKDNNLPFSYTGNGSILIGGFNPDFLNSELKQIIEVNGDYWHNREDVKLKDIRKYSFYKDKGYKVLVLWEHEIKDEPSIVINKIKDMGIEVLE